MPTSKQDFFKFVESVPFIDTHSHAAGMDTGTPVDDKAPLTLAQIIFFDYLTYLAGSAVDDIKVLDGLAGTMDKAVERSYAQIAPILDKYRALSTWRVMREGLRTLHGFEGMEINASNFDALDQKVRAKYAELGQRAWLRSALVGSNTTLQNQMVTLPYVTDHYEALSYDERRAQQAFLLPSLILDGYLFSGFASGTPGRLRTLELLNAAMGKYEDYLDVLGKALDLFKARGGWTVKLLIGYHRSLYFEEVSDRRAEDLWVKAKGTPQRNLHPDEFKALQDNLCWHLLELSRDRGLGLQVHMGYSYPTRNTDPELMMNVVKSNRLQGLKLDICHSGWPNHGGAMVMARTFRHTYFNFCWTPMLGSSLGRRIMSEAIDIVPSNKLLIGTDCATAEAFVGTVALLRSEVSTVLWEKVEGGLITEETARGVAKAIFHDNSIEYYGQSVLRLPGVQG
jgi:glucuronate isomerase